MTRRFANAIQYMNTDIVCSIYNFNAEREFMCDHFCQLAARWFCAPGFVLLVVLLKE